MERDERRERIHLVALSPQEAPTIQRTPLPAGTAGQRVRWLHRDVIQVSTRVPDGRVQKVAAHLLSGHGTTGLADAFGVIACDRACSASAAWFASACAGRALSS